MDELQQKKEKLEAYLTGLGSVAVAFSAGVDSTFLLKTAHDLLGDRAVALTVLTAFFPAREADAAVRFCEQESIKHIVVPVDVLSVPGLAENPPNRCYICKRALFTKLLCAAKEAGAAFLAEGSNADDVKDYRPGMAAIAELGVKSPLKEAGLTKGEIRVLSKALGLPTWDKPSFACLATRFPYGEPITAEKLTMAAKAEQKLFDLGFRQVRVRVHGNIARIEIEPAGFAKIVRPEVAGPLRRYLQSLGFLYVTLDLGGYETGSMNKALDK